MRVSVVIILPDGSLLRLSDWTRSICRLYTNPRAAATKKVWFPPLKRDTLLFSVYLAGRWYTPAPRCSPSTPWSWGWTRTPGSSGWTRRSWHGPHVPPGHGPTCPSLRRHAAPPSHYECCHASPRGIVFWLVSNQISEAGPGQAIDNCTGKDSQMLHNNRLWLTLNLRKLLWS